MSQTDWGFIMVIIFTLLLTLLSVPTKINPGAEIPSIIEIINEEGQFAFTDGSSTYLFMEDGSFYMEPIGMSGRAIEGSWIFEDSNSFEITGLWGWNNGISLINDKRRMTIYINLISAETEVSESLWRSSDARLYDVYFLIEEIAKIN